MNKENSAKRSTDALQKLEELFQSVWIWLHVRFLQISMMPEPADMIRAVMASPSRIALVQQRVTNRFRYPCKFALFRFSLAFRIPGNRLAAAQDPSIVYLRGKTDIHQKKIEL